MKKAKSLIVETNAPCSTEKIQSDDKNEAIRLNDQIELKDLKFKKYISVDPQFMENPSFQFRREKLSTTLKKAIKEQALGRKPSLNETKMSKLIKSAILEERFLCKICECEYKLNQRANVGNCAHGYCDSCLQHFCIFKIGMFEEVTCPSEDCDEKLDVNSPFFKSLPEDVRQKYKKVHAFYVASKNPNLRLCPNQKCDEGILQIAIEVNPTCKHCGETFCYKCLFLAHEGQCTKHEINFFQNNLHYRQCRKCKTVIEKIQGCNHMTCKCGNQFCYLCGRVWRSSGHQCPTQSPNIRFSQCCSCLDNSVCGSIMKVIIKVLICFPLFILYLFLLILKYLMLIAVFMLICILIGPIFFGLEFACTQDHWWETFILIIFLPITMLIGFGLAIKEVMCTVLSDQWEQDQEIGEECEDFFKW